MRHSQREAVRRGTMNQVWAVCYRRRCEIAKPYIFREDRKLRTILQKNLEQRVDDFSTLSVGVVLLL